MHSPRPRALAVLPLSPLPLHPITRRIQGVIRSAVAIFSTSRGCLGNVGQVAINPSQALVHSSHCVSRSAAPCGPAPHPSCTYEAFLRPVLPVTCMVSALKAVISIDFKSVGEIEVGADAAHIVEPIEGIQQLQAAPGHVWIIH